MSKLGKVAAKVASKMSKAEAEKVLAKLLPEGLSKVEHDAAIERIFKNPEESKAVRDALDVTQGSSELRQKDLGATNKNWYRGDEEPVNTFDLSKLGSNTTGPSRKLGVHFTDKPEVAADYVSNPDKVKSYKILNKQNTSVIDPEWNSLGYDEAELIKEQMRKGKETVIVRDVHDSPNVDAPKSNILITNKPQNIRLTEALFDKRYKDSPNILALQGGNEGQKIAGKLLGAAKPRVDMGLGSAFEQINEPLEQLNAPRNKAVEAASKLLGKQLDISGGKVPGMAEQNAQVLQTIGDFVIPASQDIVGGGVLKAAKAAKIAEKMGLKAAEAATKAENRTLSAAEKLLAKKPEEVLVIGNPNKPMNFGTVTVKDTAPAKTGTVTVAPEPKKPVGLPNYGSVTAPPTEQIVERYKKFIK